MDPQIVKNLADSKAATTIAKQLWPTMLFLVVMSILTFFGSWLWTKEIGNPIVVVIGYLVWLLTNTVVSAFGIHGLFMDIRIYSAGLKEGNTKTIS